jgi:hypothetical protein
MAFFDYALKQIITKDNLLVKVNNIINWEIIRNKLNDKLKPLHNAKLFCKIYN